MSNLLLEFDEMYHALADRNSEYDGVLFFGVKTTGVFCRVTCPARKPNRKNVSFFASTSEAIRAGFRPCKRCQPMEVSGKMPDWLEPVLKACEKEPGRNWKDKDIRSLGIEPKRVRRWFLTNHGITFHYFLRSQRMASALQEITQGGDLTQIAFNAGYDSASGFRYAFEQWFGCSPGRVRTASSDEQSNGCILVSRLHSPLGPLVVACDDSTIFLLEFADRKVLDSQFRSMSRWIQSPIRPGKNQLMGELQGQLNEYFAGTRQLFDFTLAIRGTKFQQQVWNELLTINYGKTASYEQIARGIGNPKAQRAVGRANGENRIAILVPCHRVIRQNGELSGYGGGTRRKEWLLEHEKAWVSRGEVSSKADA